MAANLTSKPRLRVRERGTILIVAVLIVFLVMIIVADAGLVARVEWEATANADTELKLEYALTGGYEIAKAYLVDDEENAGDVDTLLEEWSAREGIQREFNPEALDVGAGFSSAPSASDGRGGEAELFPKVTIIIEDEERKWPLPLLMVGADTQKERRKQGLINVLDDFRKGTNFDLDPGLASNYADMIANFVTRKENDQGYGPTPRPLTKSGGLLDITDLALIPGLPPSVIFDVIDEDTESKIVPGLINFLTLWSDLTINVNTAPEAVLRGLFRREEDEAIIGTNIFSHREKKSEDWLVKEDMVGLNAAERRQRERDKQKKSSLENPAPTPTAPASGKPPGQGEEESEGGVFNKVEDVKKEVRTVTERVFNEISPLLTVKSNAFTIWVEAEMRGVRKLRRYVVRRDGASFLLVLAGQVAWPRYREMRNERE